MTDDRARQSEVDGSLAGTDRQLGGVARGPESGTHAPSPCWLQQTESTVNPNDLPLDHAGILRSERHDRARHVSCLECAPTGISPRRSRQQLLGDAASHYGTQCLGINRRCRNCIDSHPMRRELCREVADNRLGEGFRYPDGRVVGLGPRRASTGEIDRAGAVSEQVLTGPDEPKKR